MTRKGTVTLVLMVGLAMFAAILPGWRARRHGAVRARPAISLVPEADRDAVPMISLAVGQDDERYRVQRSARGLRATNPRQDLTADFGADGATIEKRGRHVAVSLVSFGYSEAMKAIRPTTPRAEANRVAYNRGILTEWYANGPYGLEQGFNLATPPVKGASGPLHIALRVSGEMVASLGKDGSIFFAETNGKPLLRYAGLRARDAQGRELPAKMELQRDRLLIAVDDSGARYPIVVDPTYTQTVILTAGASGSRLGSSGFIAAGGGLAIDEARDTIVALAEGDGSGTVPGSAYVFVKQSGKWLEATQLVNADQNVASVAISGDGRTIVVGSCSLNNCIGDAFIYTISQTANGWDASAQTQPAARLSASDGKTSDRVGFSVATDHFGDTIALGAPCDFTAGITLCGSVYVFVQPGQGASPWVSSSQEQAKLIFDLPSGTTADSLGFAVGMDGLGDTIVAGTPGVEGAGANEGSGAAYVFVRPATAIDSWVTTATADATLDEFFSPFSAPPNGDRFGSALGIDFSGDTIAVGAPMSPNNCSPQPCNAHAAGMSYVFLRPTSAGGWKDAPKPKAQDAILSEKNPLAGDGMGASVAITSDGSTVVAGAASGAYVFNMPSGGWANSSPNESQLIAPMNGTDINNNSVAPNSSGLSSVLISNDGSLIGGGNGGAVVGSNQFQGAVFLFAPDVCAILQPPSYDFGTVPQYTSTDFTFTLSNVCNTTLTGISAAINGQDSPDFEINNAHGIPCGTTLAANTSCNISVTYTPVGTNIPELATLSVSDVDGSSPQRASLTGNVSTSNAIFAITPISANPAGNGCPPATADSASCTATVKSGQTAVYTLQLTSINGFNAPVPLSVLYPLGSFPQDAGPISFSSSAVVPTTAGATVTMTVGTQLSTPTSAQLARVQVPQAAIWQVALPMMGLCVLFGWKRENQPRWPKAVALCLILIGIGGCDGSCSSGLAKTTTTANSATLNPGTYTIAVKAQYPGAFFGGANPPPPQTGDLVSKVTLVVQ